MATVTKTVAASGGDYTTIAGALGWFQSNHDFDTDGIARILITDANSYNQASTLELTGISGTPSATACLEVASDATDPFSGPVINMTHSSNGGYYVRMDYTYIHNLMFHLNNTSNSTEVLRLRTGTDNVLVSRCVFIALNQQSDQEGIYFSEWPIDSLSIDNCVFLGFARAAVGLDLSGGAYTQSMVMDHCTIAVSTNSGESRGGAIFASASNASGIVNADIYNTLTLDYKNGASSDHYNDSISAGTVNWSGSNNAAEDASAESRFTSSYDSVIFAESVPSSGENAWLTEIDNADETLIDLSIAGENAYTVTGNGVSRVGSEPDPRQDFSIDIMGNARDGTTPDIGAFEFVVVGGGLSIPVAAYHYNHNMSN